jgi:hypothetical protein
MCGGRSLPRDCWRLVDRVVTGRGRRAIRQAGDRGTTLATGRLPAQPTRARMNARAKGCLYLLLLRGAEASDLVQLDSPCLVQPKAYCNRGGPIVVGIWHRVPQEERRAGLWPGASAVCPPRAECRERHISRHRSEAMIAFRPLECYTDSGGSARRWMLAGASASRLVQHQS